MNSQYDVKIREELGKTLWKARKKAKLTQLQVAEKAGVNKNYYAIIERGEANPSYGKLRSIMEALEIKSINISS